MLEKKFIGTFAFVTAFVSLMILMGDFAYAKEEEHEHKVPHRSVEAASPSEKPTMEYPVCPHCKEVRLTSNTKRGIVAGKKMECPHCKGGVKELAVHHCDKCGNDVMVCVLCQKASVDLEPATMESRCPKCKNVLARRIKGTIAPPVVWEMKCPDCGKKSEVWLDQHCDTCDIDFIACPLCKKGQEKQKS
ncbi:MAG: hypothetical protein MRK01_00675 [Candidatus Scalindua sp.]|nr:hypothetical protein [Candidatus Scalindua sp.]